MSRRSHVLTSTRSHVRTSDDIKGFSHSHLLGGEEERLSARIAVLEEMLPGK